MVKAKLKKVCKECGRYIRDEKRMEKGGDYFYHLECYEKLFGSKSAKKKRTQKKKGETN